MKIRLPWGNSEVELTLPEGWRIIAEARPKGEAACASVRKEFERAMARPIGVAPLIQRQLRGKRIVIVVDDLTRPTPAHLFFPYLLRELESAGAQREDLLVITALGVHRPMTDAGMEAKIGRESLAALRWENHDAYSSERLARVGTTRAGTPVDLNRALVRADLIVSVGTIEPHVLAGFGGGLKNLVPGCAGAQTIARNHLCGTTGHELAQIGVDPESNPLRRDLEQAAGFLPAEVFLVNTVLNPAQEIVRIFAGHPEFAHRKGIKLAREIYGVETPEPADILITDSSPMDSDLRQGAKCIGNTLGAVKEGGTILAFLRCREGVGDFKLSGVSLPRPLTKALARALSRRQLLGYLERFRRDLPIEEKFLAFYSLQILSRYEVLAYAPAVPAQEAKRLALFRCLSDPQELVRRAAARAPSRATVAVFPQGGVTFPLAPLRT